MRFCIFACNMVKKKKKTRRRGGLQVVTLCISTAMVLILLGMVVFSVLTARNLSNYVKENLTVTLMLAEDMTNPEAQKLCADLKKKHYVYGLTYISKEDVLKEQTKELGADPSEFVGTNPFVGSVELQLKADYANNDSLVWIAKELKKNAQVTEITYPQMLIGHCFLLADKQQYQTECLCAEVYHQDDEAGGCLMGLYPAAFP